MAEQSLAKKVGVTPGRLVLIGVLGVVFVAVVMLQNSGEEPAQKVARRSPQPLRPVTEAKASAANKKPTRRTPAQASRKGPRKNWPRIDIDTVVQHDPFAVPLQMQARSAALPPAPPGGRVDVQQRAEALRELRSKGVDMVLVTERGKVAKIGDRLFRVGDVINGFRITDITPQGIVVDLDAAETQSDR